MLRGIFLYVASTPPSRRRGFSPRFESIHQKPSRRSVHMPRMPNWRGLWRNADLQFGQLLREGGGFAMLQLDHQKRSRRSVHTPKMPSWRGLWHDAALQFGQICVIGRRYNRSLIRVHSDISDFQCRTCPISSFQISSSKRPSLNRRPPFVPIRHRFIRV